MKQRTFWIVFTIGIILRVFWINVPPLWYDENFTLILVRLPFAQMIQATAGDVHPPLWYIIEWTLYHISPVVAPWQLRLPALFFSIVSMVLIYQIMDSIDVPPNIQTATMFLVAVMPFQLWYAQEARMYAMLEFFVLFTLLAALDCNYWMIFIGSLGLLYTQNYGPFYLAAIALVIFFREGRERIIWSLAAMTSAGVLWLPWFVIVQRQMNDITGRYWIMDKSLGAVLTTIYKLFLTAAVPQEFFFASYAVTFAALILGIFSIIRSHHPERLTVAIMAFAPLFIAWIVSLVWQPVLLFRPLIGISPFLYLVVCWSFEQHVLPSDL